MRVLTDSDVRGAPAAVVVDAAREALIQAGRGELTGPPRARSELGDVDYVYTAGALADETSGFRVYRAGHPAGDQLVAVWAADGHLAGLVVGEELGVRRTGALGRSRPMSSPVPTPPPSPWWAPGGRHGASSGH